MNKKYVVILLVGILIVWSSLTATYLYDKWLDYPYMTADDPDNPGSYGNLIITNEVKLLSDEIVNRDDTPHKKTMKYINWTRENIIFKPAPPRMAHPHVIIESRIGQCGDYAIVITSFLASQGIPSRIINMYFEKESHATIEVYYNNSWHMYGPVFGTWVDTDGRVFSFEELQNGAAFNGTLINTNANPDIALQGTILADPSVYVIADPAGVIGPEHPMWFNLKLDNEKSVPPVGSHAAGYRHIGATYINVCQNWTILNLTPGTDYSFVIYPKRVFPAGKFVLYVNETMCEYSTTGNSTSGTPVYINFTARGEVENLHIWHPYTGKDDIIITVEKYEVIERH